MDGANDGQGSGTSYGDVAFGTIEGGLSEAGGSRAVLTRMLRVMFPHDRFPDAIYARAATSILAEADKVPGEKIRLASGLEALEAHGFMEMDPEAARAHLKGIETGAFFQHVHGEAITTLYDNAEVWELLGYEGPSYDKGGYVDRGFDDLDWLPDPRIDEYRGNGA